MRTFGRIVSLIAIVMMLWFAGNEYLKPGYTYNVWINIDELANALLYGDNETISARLGRYQLEGSFFADQFCAILDVFFEEEDHCINSIGD